MKKLTKIEAIDMSIQLFMILAAVIRSEDIGALKPNVRKEIILLTDCFIRSLKSEIMNGSKFTKKEYEKRFRELLR